MQLSPLTHSPAAPVATPHVSRLPLVVVAYLRRNLLSFRIHCSHDIIMSRTVKHYSKSGDLAPSGGLSLADMCLNPPFSITCVYCSLLGQSICTLRVVLCHLLISRHFR